MKSIALASAATSVSALVAPSWLSTPAQNPLVLGSKSPAYQCDLPPAIDPSKDGLPSGSKLFGHKAALNLQIERHQALVRVPSICYDNLGEPDEDERYAPFFELHETLEYLYPTL